MKKLYILPVVLCLTLSAARAQLSDLWEIGLYIGQSFYQGDLADSRADLDHANVSFGITGRYDYAYTLNIRGNLFVGNISGSDLTSGDSGRAKRGISFQTSIIELSGLAEWEPLGEMRKLDGGKKKLFLSPYLMGGAGLAFTNPRPSFPELGNPSSQSPELQDFRAGYSKVHIVFPLGGGLRYDVNRKWMVGAEIAGRLTFTDYLDGVSIAGNSDTTDWYWFYGFTVMFKPAL